MTIYSTATDLLCMVAPVSSVHRCRSSENAYFGKLSTWYSGFGSGALSALCYMSASPAGALSAAGVAFASLLMILWPDTSAAAYFGPRLNVTVLDAPSLLVARLQATLAPHTTQHSYEWPDESSFTPAAPQDWSWLGRNTQYLGYLLADVPSLGSLVEKFWSTWP